MMNKKRRSSILLGICLILLSLSACSQAMGKANQKTITISGAWALYPMAIRWSEEFQAIHPEIRFDISAGGAGKGMADVLADAVDIGMVSREIYPQETEQGALGFAVAKDAVFLTVNSNNPVWNELKSTGVTRKDLIEIFLEGSITDWEDLVGTQGTSHPIHLFTRSDACGAAETWAKFLGKRQEDLLGIGVYGDPGVLESVISDPLGIGYNNLNYAFDVDTGLPVEGIHVVPLDINNNGVADPQELLNNKSLALEAVGNGIYPSPPARDLYLVVDGQPQGIVKEFILWVITDGRVFLSDAGYVPIPQQDLISELEILSAED